MSGYKKSFFKRVRYYLLYQVVRFLIAISNSVSRVAWLKFCGRLTSLGFPFATQTRNLMIKNIGIAFGKELNDEQIRALAKKTFKMMGRNAGDILRATKVQSLADVEKFLVTHNLDIYENALAKKRGIVFITGHLGAFDLQVTNMALRGLNPNIIGTPIKDERLNKLLWEYRNKYGANAIERGKETFRLIKVLKSGGSVALLIDQDTKVKSRFVDFFGRPASTPVGATILAMKTGAVVVPTSIYLGEDWKQHMSFFPEVPMRDSGDEEADVIYNTQVLTTIIENMIRAHPDQWVWMHDRWKTKPGQEIR
ncbi:lysophospholipid acyltransferase family protein [Chryseolinea sp. T2]|uniref:lysophospholipid acyltransferase family protein n=1 Tax=Chryseolinea sp. T2 TaxID=3129255 RepID=UPI003077B44B